MESESGSYEGVGALVGAALGGTIGLAVGAGSTSAHRFELPPHGTHTTWRADDITIQDATILRETDLSVTILWYSRTTTLPKDQIAIRKKAGEIFIRAPRSLLYDGDKPRHIDD